MPRKTKLVGAALTMALLLCTSTSLASRTTRGGPATEAAFSHSKRFIADHTNVILSRKCRDTYDSYRGTRAQWLRRHRLAHRAKRGRCAPVPGGTSVLATWYGPGFYGNGTACGSALTQGSMWVAHRTLPCGTRLILCTVRCVRTYVWDRGPYSAATFDLAPGLARALGCYCTQTVRWRYG